MLYRNRYITYALLALSLEQLICALDAGPKLAAPEVAASEVGQQPTQAEIETFLMHCREVQKRLSQQLGKLSLAQQTLSQALSDGKITVSDPMAIKALLESYGKQFLGLQKLLTDGTDPYKIQEIGYLVRGLVGEIGNQVDTKFAQASMTPLEQYLPKSQSGMVPMVDLLDRNEAMLVGLDGKIKQATLTPLNRAVRLFDPLIAPAGYVMNVALVAGALYAGYKGVGALNNFLTAGIDYQVFEKNRTDCVNKLFFGSILAGSVSGVASNKMTSALDWAWNKIEHPLWRKYYQTRDFMHRVHSYARGNTDSLDAQHYQFVEDIDFDDPRLIGLEDQKKQLSIYIDFLRDPELYLRTNNVPEHGILLYGPSGSGKTELARALAGTINKMYRALGRADKVAFREYRQEAMKEIPLDAILEDARQHAPCIVFIDEIHTLKLQTGTDATKLSQFLTDMVSEAKNKDPKSQVFILAATNKPQQIDRALWRHERFGLQIEFFLPHTEYRERFFSQGLRDSGISTDDLDVASLVRQTKGCSYGDLQAIKNDARTLASSLGSGVGQYHLQEAINDRVHGFVRKVQLSDVEVNFVAAHQAGAACVHVLLNMDAIVEFVTIWGVRQQVREDHEFAYDKNATKQELRYGKLLTSMRGEQNWKVMRSEHIAECKRLLAGSIAQELLCGSRSGYGVQDKQTAFDKALTIILDGLDLKSLSEKKQDEKRDEAALLLDTFSTEVRDLLTQNHDKLQKVYDALKKEQTLSGAQVSALLMG